MRLIEREQVGLKETGLPITSIPAIVLCAGLGTRMRPKTETIPKPLVEVEPNKSLLDYVLKLLDSSGVRQGILCISQQGKQISDHYATSYDSLNLTYSIEASPVSVLETFRTALENYPPSSDFFLLHGDEIIDNVSLQSMYQYHLTHSGVATALVSLNPEVDRTVVMRLDENQKVTSVVRNEVIQDGSLYLASLGLFLFRPSIIDDVRMYDSWEEMVKTLSKQNRLYGFISQAKFYNINSPEDITRFLESL